MAGFKSLESKGVRNVKKQFRDRIRVFISALVGIGAANGSVFAADSTTGNTIDRAAIARQLIESGFIAPHRRPGWFIVNRILLDRTIRDAELGFQKQRSVVDELKKIVGPEVDIREVDLFEAKVGTQDHM
jgi:hypothetical protein